MLGTLQSSTAQAIPNKIPMSYLLGQNGTDCDYESNKSINLLFPAKTTFIPWARPSQQRHTAFFWVSQHSWSARAEFSVGRRQASPGIGLS